MFKVEIDMSLCFNPPMAENAPGIRVTRTLELPFPPVEGMYLTGLTINGQPMVEGNPIEDVTWDLDRQVFLVNAKAISVNLPIAFIPLDIMSWLERGWRLGSFEEAYQDESDKPTRERTPKTIAMYSHDDLGDEAEHWPTMNPRSRPPAFNQFLRALVREMASLQNNWPIAYAIDQTKVFFTEGQLKGNDARSAIKFQDAVRRFEGMSFDQQYDWYKRVIQKNPRLESMLTDGQQS